MMRYIHGLMINPHTLQILVGTLGTPTNQKCMQPKNVFSKKLLLEQMMGNGLIHFVPKMISIMLVKCLP